VRSSQTVEDERVEDDMRTKRTVGLAVAAAVALGALTATGASAANGVVPAATPTLTDEEVAGLVFTREEERVAHDLYTVFAQEYDDVAVFARIAASETRHADAIETLLDGYGIDDPSAGLPAGTYADDDLQALYDRWETQGLTSVQDAYEVGVELETADVADLQGFIDTTEVADLDRVYSRLLSGSEHHLAAFTAAAAGELPVGAGPGTGPRASGGDGMGTGAMSRGGGRGGQGMQGSGNGTGLRDGSCLTTS
jgi:hypothetical protein